MDHEFDRLFHIFVWDNIESGILMPCIIHIASCTLIKDYKLYSLYNIGHDSGGITKNAGCKPGFVVAENPTIVGFCSPGGE